MSDELSVFEECFRGELLEVPELVEYVGNGVLNMVAGPKAVLPYAIFTVIPLEDNTGQARTSIQTRLLVDLKFVDAVPPSDRMGPAIAAVKEHFRKSLTYYHEGYAISIRHDRPISMIERGRTADERLLNRGCSFRVWMSRTE